MERSLRIAYLGSAGSFSEEAARSYAGRLGHAVELHGAPAPAAVLERLARGGCDLAVLPVANSCGGLVWTTLAALGGRGLELVDEVLVPVRFGLFAARSGLGLADVERVASHPQAFRQCERTLARLLPGRERLPWGDTASAARDLAAGELDERTAVLASAHAGERFRLAPLAADVHDEPDNRTFFAVLRRSRGAALDRGSDMTIQTDDIDIVRSRIGEIDTAILRLLGERFIHVRLLGRWKARAALPIDSPEREAELRTLYLKAAQREGLDPKLVLRVFELVLEHSRTEQRAQALRPKAA
jgi:prephenate dehydratase